VLADRSTLLYVGAAGGENGVQGRIEDHITRARRTAAFTSVYPVHAVVGVTWCRDYHHADTREWGRAGTIAGKHPDAAVWCDGGVVG
jgi:predicted GIY-YIG superfamily endonuclease